MPKKKPITNKKTNLLTKKNLIILIIGIIVAVFLISNANLLSKIYPEIRPIYSFVDSCLESTIIEGVYSVSETGGYLVPTGLITDDRIAYYYSDETNLVPEKITLEKELSLYIDTLIGSCLKKFEKFPEVDVETGELNLITSINDNNLIIKVDYLIDVIEDGNNYSFNEFYYEIPMRLGKVHKVSEEITQNQIEYGGDICIGCIAEIGLENDVYINAIQSDNDTLIFIIRDLNSDIDGRVFRYYFATEHAAPPGSEIDLTISGGPPRRVSDRLLNEQKSKPKIDNTIQPVGKLFVFDNNDNLISDLTTFYIGKIGDIYYWVTAGHAIDNQDDNFDIELYDKNGNVVGVVMGRVDDVWYEPDKVKGDKTIFGPDLLLIAVDEKEFHGVDSNRLSPIKLAPKEDETEIGDEILEYGCDSNNYGRPTRSPCRVSRILQGKEIIETKGGNAKDGYSGGPALNKDGNLVGIHVSGNDEKTGYNIGKGPIIHFFQKNKLDKFVQRFILIFFDFN